MKALLEDAKRHIRIIDHKLDDPGVKRLLKRKARSGRSPATGKEIRITAKTVPAFAAGQGFKQAVDK